MAEDIKCEKNESSSSVDPHLGLPLITFSNVPIVNFIQFHLQQMKNCILVVCGPVNVATSDYDKETIYKKRFKIGLAARSDAPTIDVIFECHKLLLANFRPKHVCHRCIGPYLTYAIETDPVHPPITMHFDVVRTGLLYLTVCKRREESEFAEFEEIKPMKWMVPRDIPINEFFSWLGNNILRGICQLSEYYKPLDGFPRFADSSNLGVSWTNRLM
jgi:hypothetical protein